LSSLQTAATALTGSQVQAQTATSSDTGIVTATTDGSADLGSHTIAVTQLAQQQKLSSSGFATTSTVVGTGKIKIEFGSVVNGAFVADMSKTAQQATITSANKTLTGIRDAVNASGLGVTVSIVNDGSTNGNRLVFTSNNSGTSNTLKISVTDDDGNNTNASGLSQLAYDPAVSGSVTQVQIAKNATLSVDGIDMTKSSNSVSDAIPGVTLNLLAKQTTDSPVNSEVNWDKTSITKTVTAFVDAYNSTKSMIATQTSFDPTGAVAPGALNGQFLPRNILNGIRNALTNNFDSSGIFTSLADLGISLDKDGALSLDSTALGIALRQSPKDFKAILSNVGSTIKTLIGNQIDPYTGTFATNKKNLDSQQLLLTKQQTVLQAQLDATQARYTAQFSALDTIMSKLQSTSTFLTQQMNILTNSYSTSK
ncbi:MAG: flagellar filament capping protein FliD, partial [Candidatus Methylumidiphilus sp.]